MNGKKKDPGLFSHLSCVEMGGNYRLSFSKMKRNCFVLSGGFRGFSTLKQRSVQLYSGTKENICRMHALGCHQCLYKTSC